jgi:K(+)-stimulated pyrophosphate-energized sodium pump
MSDFLLGHGIALTIVLAIVGLAVALYLIYFIMKCPTGTDKMREVADAIREGAKAYLRRQVLTISVIATALFLLIYGLQGLPVAIGFVLGAVCSLTAGYIGMRVAVISNVRVAQGATQSAHRALQIAFNGGAVTGMLVVGLGLLSVAIFYIIIERMFGASEVTHSLIGLALGASLISVFARLGGGIYTKAADVGADLVGKIEAGMDEDDPRNPAVIADNVGDNVGDCAGMAADVFETYAVSLIGGILVGFLAFGGANPGDLATVQKAAMMYPLVLGGISIVGATLGIIYINVVKGDPTRVLMGGVITSGIVSAIFYWPATHWLFTGPIQIGSKTIGATQMYWASVVGLIMTAVVVAITNYYTSARYRPVRRIAEASITGHATNIIAGLAVGQHATALPVGFIGVAILLSYHFAGLYGIAIAVVSMLSMAGIIISLDSFGPITDNAGGVAVMGGLPKEVRTVTDGLDSVGNTMKAVTKGYAIASAGLAALVLFGSYVEELRTALAPAGADAVGGMIRTLEFSLQEPKVIIGLFIGGLLPFWFTAYAMDAVGKAAGAVVLEVRRQMKEKPGIMNHTEKPDYGRCVDIVTRAALKQMIVPALLPLVLSIGSAWLLGPIVLGGVLVGTIVTGLFVAIAMTSGGGAWDNAKKYIEEGNLGGKGSAAHAAAVTGDTVGDPYKDTAGPAVNPMIKVVNVVAILLIPIALKLEWSSWTKLLKTVTGNP